MLTKRVLVTGGSGYIGSHTFLSLWQEQHEVFAIDNYANSSPAPYERIQQLSNQTVSFADKDVTDDKALASILDDLASGHVKVLDYVANHQGIEAD